MRKKSKILIIVDMQNDFIDGALANPAAKAIVPGIIDLLNKEEFDEIICTLDTHGSHYMETVEGKNLPVPHCIKYTSGWCLNKDIMNRLNNENIEDPKFYLADKCEFVEKETFGCSELVNYINCDDEIYFVGTCTGICVINNVAVVKAGYPNNKIVVYEDLCACLTPETHQRAIDQMKFNHIEIEKWGK